MKQASTFARNSRHADVGDVMRAQALPDEQLRTPWNRLLRDLVRECHPVHAASPMFQREPYYWSADETEWTTDVMFRSREDLAEVYPGLVRHSVTPVGCGSSDQKILHTHRYILTDKGRLTITAILAAQNAITKQPAQLAA